MKCNIGKTDKNIRITLGGILLLLGGWYQNWIIIILGIIATITAILGFCGLYLLFKINTNKK